MKYFIRSTPILGAMLVAALVSFPVHADDWNQLTCLTFSGPVELPGLALPAGSYVFKHLDSIMSDRHIVQVFSADRRAVYGTFLTIPDDRLKPADKTVVTFIETPVGTPEAIKAWFYPGETIGEEFVYPREEALKIAKETHQGVLSTSSSAAAIQKAVVTRINETEKPEPIKSNGSAQTAPMKVLKNSKATSAGISPCGF